MRKKTTHVEYYILCVHYFQEKICEDSTSFDLRSADLAAAIRELTMMSEKVMNMASDDDQKFDMGDSQVISKLTQIVMALRNVYFTV